MTTDSLAAFHPIVRDWFTETLGEPSAPQRAGWPAIASGGDTLILAPTGTGKTLAAFLWELNALIAEGLEAPLANAVHLLYVSPLKALNNDVQRNLEMPLAQLKARFEKASANPSTALGMTKGARGAAKRAVGATNPVILPALSEAEGSARRACGVDDGRLYTLPALSDPRATRSRWLNRSLVSGSIDTVLCREVCGNAERPTVGWREVYHELKRLEFRGEVLRGYFVLVTLGGRIILSSEGRGSRVRVREG